ncbi:hypothetical protein FQA39_LY17175 [Lamprigera yunnana]|nr:hypothetical protein FQA39_LY17175 [Lamprigera yunnana]
MEKRHKSKVHNLLPRHSAERRTNSRKLYEGHLFSFVLDHLSSNNTLCTEKATQSIEAVECYTSAEIAESTCSAETYLLSETEIIIEADANAQMNEIIPTEVAENPIFEDNNNISLHSGYRPSTPNDPAWVATNSEEGNIDQEPSDLRQKNLYLV